jgi:hypothetical protein
MAGSAATYFSPTLRRLKEEEDAGLPTTRYPTPDAACTDCPASIWYADKEGDLRCYCTILHTTTWDGKRDPISHCDGREQELAAMGGR